MRGSKNFKTIAKRQVSIKNKRTSEVEPDSDTKRLRDSDELQEMSDNLDKVDKLNIKGTDTDNRGKSSEAVELHSLNIGEEQMDEALEAFKSPQVLKKLLTAEQKNKVDSNITAQAVNNHTTSTDRKWYQVEETPASNMPEGTVDPDNVAERTHEVNVDTLMQVDKDQCEKRDEVTNTLVERNATVNQVVRIELDADEDSMEAIERNLFEEVDSNMSEKLKSPSDSNSTAKPLTDKEESLDDRVTKQESCASQQTWFNVDRPHVTKIIYKRSRPETRSSSATLGQQGSNSATFRMKTSSSRGTTARTPANDSAASSAAPRSNQDDSDSTYGWCNCKYHNQDLKKCVSKGWYSSAITKPSISYSIHSSEWMEDIIDIVPASDRSLVKGILTHAEYNKLFAKLALALLDQHVKRSHLLENLTASLAEVNQVLEATKRK